MNKIKEFILKNIKIIGIVGALFAILGTIIPQIYVFNLPLYYIDGDGKFIVILATLSLYFIIRNKAKFCLPTSILMMAIICIYLYLTSPAQAANNLIEASVQYGPGLYLMIIGPILTLLYSIFGSNEARVMKNKKGVEFKDIKTHKGYYLFGLVLPIVGYYIYYKDVNSDSTEDIHKAISMLRGAILGTAFFFLFIFFKIFGA